MTRWGLPSLSIGIQSGPRIGIQKDSMRIQPEAEAGSRRDIVPIVAVFSV
jgi:hypothetical protein